MTVSKNPPLTEDQIRQSAEAEARHAAAQASRHAQLDYMIAQQRQQQVAASLETIFGSEEDRFKAAASLIEDSAHRAIEEQDRVHDPVRLDTLGAEPTEDQRRVRCTRSNHPLARVVQPSLLAAQHCRQ